MKECTQGETKPEMKQMMLEQACIDNLLFYCAYASSSQVGKWDEAPDEISHFIMEVWPFLNVSFLCVSGYRLDETVLLESNKNKYEKQWFPS